MYDHDAPPHDWSILEDPEVERAIQNAVGRVSSDKEVDDEDLLQEARARVSNLSTDLPECAYAGEYGLLGYRLMRDLVDITKREVRNRARNVSFDDRYAESEGDEAKASPFAMPVVRNEVGCYTRELVSALVPAVWDSNFCYGMRVENAPDSDMPRASTNKSTGNTLAAHIADIGNAWQKARLTPRQKQVLFLVSGMDWKQSEVAFNLGISQQKVSEYHFIAIGKLMNFLNGTSVEYSDSEDLLELAA